MSTTLQIKSTDSNGKDYQKSITFVNSSCSAAALKEFAARFNALSTNTLVDTHVVRRNIVEDDVSTEKLTPTFKFNDHDPDDPILTYTYDGDGEVYMYSTGMSILDRVSKTISPFSPSGYIELYASEGERYKAAKITYGTPPNT